MPADRLSISGKVGLRRLVDTAFRQVGIGSLQEQWGRLPKRPVRISEARGFFAAAQSRLSELMDSLMWGRDLPVTSFELTDHHGKRRTDGHFRGKLLIVYFGYMFCPDICPTDLQVIAQAIDQLGSAGDAVQPRFVTLDPERDTPEKLASYVPLFHPSSDRPDRNF